MDNLPIDYGNSKKLKSKFMKKQFEKTLFDTLLVMIAIAALVCSYAWSVQALTGYIYEQTTKPFLVQAPQIGTGLATTSQRQ